MNGIDTALELGLEQLQQRRRLIGQSPEITDLDRKRLARQVELAAAPWSAACEFLQIDPQLVSLLEKLWPQVLPLLVKGAEVSPIHHIAWVVRFMAEIGVAELSPRDLRRGVLAALFHDIGIGDCLLPKISESLLRNASAAEWPTLREQGIRSRREHMEFGVQRTRAILAGCCQDPPGWLTDDDVAVILDIVGTHDNAKIPLMDEHAARSWYLTPEPADWLKQCHWEADALWMLTPEGIAVDLDRDGKPWSADAAREKRAFNLGLHQKIVTLYRQAWSPEDFQRFGFRDGTLYRSGTGARIAGRLMALELC